MKVRAFLTSLFIIGFSTVLSVVALALWPLSPRGGIFLFIARIWPRAIFRVGGIRLRTVVAPGLDPAARYVYLSNHESLTDILALYAALPQKVVMVAKRSLLVVPLFSWGMWLAGFVFINRRNRASAYRSIEAAGARLRRRSVLVFPEGTRAVTPDLLPFKRGGFVLARSAGVPIVPVGIYGTRRLLPRDRFCVFPGRIAVCVGAPIPAPRATADCGAGAHAEPGSMEPWMAEVRLAIESLREEARRLVEGEAIASRGPQLRTGTFSVVDAT